MAPSTLAQQMVALSRAQAIWSVQSGPSKIFYQQFVKNKAYLK